MHPTRQLADDLEGATTEGELHEAGRAIRQVADTADAILTTVAATDAALLGGE